MEIFAKQSGIMTKQIRKELESGEFDIWHYVTLCFIDIVCGEEHLHRSWKYRFDDKAIHFRFGLSCRNHYGCQDGSSREG